MINTTKSDNFTTAAPCPSAPHNTYPQPKYPAEPKNMLIATSQFYEISYIT
jgi:hypothetical protein